MVARFPGRRATIRPGQQATNDVARHAGVSTIPVFGVVDNRPRPVTVFHEQLRIEDVD